MSQKPRLLVLSHVLPFPGTAGQQQRVLNTLIGLKPLFHLTFLTVPAPGKEDETRCKLLETCDEVIFLPSLYQKDTLSKLWHRLRGAFFCWRTGLKASNYVLGEVEFTAKRLKSLLENHQFDGVLYEYFHAHKSTSAFRAKGIPTVLDMHDIMWQTYQRQMEFRGGPQWWKNRALALYKRAEEKSWQEFDVLISINDAEHDYARARVPEKVPFINAYMGVNAEQEWPYQWQPSNPPRVAYYGGLATIHNQQAAKRCYERIMPLIWEKVPQAEFWIVGSNPPASLKELAQDKRVCVTGFVPQVSEVLRTLTAIICPWSGQYGFRSRLIEAMALGVPVVATADAVYGMNISDGDGILLKETDADMAQATLQLLQKFDYANQQSRAARLQVEEKYSFDATYGHLARELRSLLSK